MSLKKFIKKMDKMYKKKNISKIVTSKKTRNPEVSVVICTYNDSRYLPGCIKHILNQDYRDFELIIIDDASTDSTPSIVNSFNDKRIRYFRLEKNTGVIGMTRNIGVEKTGGKYVFFTDSDCYANPDWISKSLKEFTNGVVAVEGAIVYVSRNYEFTFSDIPSAYNLTGGQFMTGNMAYLGSLLRKERFNDNLKAFEDRELGLRLLKHGKIPFCRESVVYHQRKKMTIRQYMNTALRAESRVMLIKYQNDRVHNKGIFLHPKHYIKILLPFMIITTIIRNRFRTWDDYRLIPFIYFKFLYTRLIIWRAAIKYRILVL